MLSLGTKMDFTNGVVNITFRSYINSNCETRRSVSRIPARGIGELLRAREVDGGPGRKSWAEIYRKIGEQLRVALV